MEYFQAHITFTMDSNCSTSYRQLRQNCEVINEMFHIVNCGFWNQVSYDHRSYEHNKQLRVEAWKSQDFNGI